MQRFIPSLQPLQEGPSPREDAQGINNLVPLGYAGGNGELLSRGPHQSEEGDEIWGESSIELAEKGRSSTHHH